LGGLVVIAKVFSQFTNQYIFFTLGRFYEKGCAHSL